MSRLQHCGAVTTKAINIEIDQWFCFMMLRHLEGIFRNSAPKGVKKVKKGIKWENSFIGQIFLKIIGTHKYTNNEILITTFSKILSLRELKRVKKGKIFLVRLS